MNNTQQPSTFPWYKKHLVSINWSSKFVHCMPIPVWLSVCQSVQALAFRVFSTVCLYHIPGHAFETALAVNEDLFHFINTGFLHAVIQVRNFRNRCDHEWFPIIFLDSLCSLRQCRITLHTNVPWHRQGLRKAIAVWCFANVCSSRQQQLVKQPTAQWDNNTDKFVL